MLFTIIFRTKNKSIRWYKLIQDSQSNLPDINIELHFSSSDSESEQSETNNIPVHALILKHLTKPTNDLVEHFLDTESGLNPRFE